MYILNDSKCLSSKTVGTDDLQAILSERDLALIYNPKYFGHSILYIQKEQEQNVLVVDVFSKDYALK